LAIELAAARLPLFNVGELRRAVEASLQVVTGGGADRPPRQRSLQHSFGWSYALLSPGEQSLLLLLGLCDAAFDHHDSQGLAGAGAADPELELQRLVELGFVAHRDASFEVVPAIREFARQRLQQHAERAGLQSRFIDHFVLRAEALKAPIESCEPAQIRQALSAFAAQSPNFFAALATAHEAGRQADVCRLVMQLAQLWGYSGMWHESKLWIDRASQHAEALEAQHRPELMCNICVYWRRHGVVEQALAAGKQAVVFAEQAGEPGVLVRALLFTGATSVGTTQFQLEEFSACLRRARPLAARLPDTRWKWAVVVNQAMIHFYRGDLRRAGAMLAVCYERTKSIGNDLGRGKIQSNLAKVLVYSGKPEAAWANFEQVLATYQEGTSPGIIAESHLAAGWFHCSQMDIVQARQTARVVRETMRDVDSDYLQVPISLLEGQIALLADQAPQAVERLSAAVVDEIRHPDPMIAFDAQLWCFRAAMRSGADDIAAQALTAALRSRLRWPREHPRILETAAAWFAHQQREDAAAQAWLQAAAIRHHKGLVRFPAERAMAEQTCMKLAQNLGPDWPSRWQADIPAIDGDDPLAWLVGALSAAAQPICAEAMAK
jgi:tetratricopeptide (TPR) repeat protein